MSLAHHTLVCLSLTTHCPAASSRLLVDQAGFRGGALFIPYLMSSLSLATANFTHNTAVYGGAIYAGSDHSSYYM